MILVIIRMKVHSEKRLELSQTITLLSGHIRMEKGCRRCDFCQNVEKENELYPPGGMELPREPYEPSEVGAI